MPVPRKSVRSATKRSVVKKKKPAAGRAKPGERLLVTCAPLLSEYAMESLAETLHGMMLVDEDGRYQCLCYESHYPTHP